MRLLSREHVKVQKGQNEKLTKKWRVYVGTAVSHNRLDYIFLSGVRSESRARIRCRPMLFKRPPKPNMLAYACTTHEILQDWNIAT